MKYLKFSALLLLVAVLYSCSEKKCTDPVINLPDYSEVRIGVLSDTSRSNIEVGNAIKNSFEVAYDELRNEQNQNSSFVNIKYKYADHKSYPDTVLALMKKMHEEDSIDIFYGIIGKNEVGAVKDYIDQENLILVGFSSSSSELEVDDNLFNFTPSRNIQYELMARAMNDANIKHVITMETNHDGTADTHPISKYLAEYGISTGKNINLYEKETETSEDIEQLRKEIIDAHEVPYKSEEIAVYVDSFFGLWHIMHQLDEEIFSTVKWYGSTVSHAIFELDLYTIPDFAQEVGYIGMNLILDDIAKDKFNIFNKKYKAKTGQEAEENYAYYYDAAKLMITTAVQCRNANTSVFKNQFIKTANNYIGASGFTALDQYGAIKYATYNFDTPIKKDDEWTWETQYTLSNY